MVGHFAFLCIGTGQLRPLPSFCTPTDGSDRRRHHEHGKARIAATTFGKQDADKADGTRSMHARNGLTGSALEQQRFMREMEQLHRDLLNELQRARAINSDLEQEGYYENRGIQRSMQSFRMAFNDLKRMLSGEIPLSLAVIPVLLFFVYLFSIMI